MIYVAAITKMIISAYNCLCCKFQAVSVFTYNVHTIAHEKVCAIGM